MSHIWQMCERFCFLKLVCHAFLYFNTFTGKSWYFRCVINHSLWLRLSSDSTSFTERAVWKRNGGDIEVMWPWKFVYSFLILPIVLRLQNAFNLWTSWCKKCKNHELLFTAELIVLQLLKSRCKIPIGFLSREHGDFEIRCIKSQ